VIPATGDAKDAPPRSLSQHGYNVRHWAHGGFVFWAVSAVDPAELVKLREALLARQ